MIRRCELSDLAALQVLAYRTYDETFRSMNPPETMDAYLGGAFATERMEAELRNPDSAFFFLYHDDSLAGYLKLNEKQAQTDFRDKDWLEIERVYVKKEFQGLGLGKLLVAKGIEAAQEKGKPAVWLGVWEKNEKAIAFYRKVGFRIVGTHDFIMGEERQRDYLMVKELNNPSINQPGN